MAACPNKNSEEWKQLVEEVGSEAEALYLFIQNNYEIPSDIGEIMEKDSYFFDESDDALIDLTEVIETKARVSHALAANYNIFKNSDNETYSDEMRKLINDFREADIQQSIGVFVNNSISKMKSLRKRMKENTDDLALLHTINDFAGTFQLIKELNPIIKNERYGFSDEMKRAAAFLSDDVETFNSEYIKHAKKVTSKRLGAESTRVRHKIKEELRSEYQKNNPKSESTLSGDKYREMRDLFVDNELSKRADEIKNKEIAYVAKLLNTAPRDLGVLTAYLVDPRSINDHVIQLTVKMLDDADFNAEEDFRSDKVDAVKIWDRFIKGESLNTESLKEPVQETIEKLKANAEKLTLSEDENHYVDKRTGKKYKRVTNFINDGKEVEETELLKSASAIGTALDVMVRDYFNPDHTFNEADYNVITGNVRSTFIAQLESLKEKFKESGETVVSDDILLFSDKHDVAGTVDLLTYDKDGNFRIYDMKTMRQDQHKKDKYGKLPYDNDKVFEKTGKFKADGSPKYRVVKGEKQDSNRTKHSKQLSMYSRLLKEQTGRGAVELNVIPIKVFYNEKDRVSSQAEIRDLVPIKHTDVRKIRNKVEPLAGKSKPSVPSGINSKGVITDQKKVYEGIIEKIDGKETQYYVREMYSTFYESRRVVNKEYAELVELDKEDEAKKLLADWKKIHLKNPAKKGEVSNIKDEFKNPQFKELEKNPSRKEMYDFLVAFNAESDNMVTSNGKLNYKLPSITKKKGEIITDNEGAGAVAKELWSDIFDIKIDDTAYGDLEVTEKGVRVLTDQKGNPLKKIAVPFRGKLDVNNQSFDLMGMALTNRYVARNFKEKNMIKPTIEMLKDVVAERNVQSKDGKENIMQTTARMLGLKHGDIEAINQETKGISSRAYMVLDSIVDDRLYGKSSMATTKAQIRIDKLAGKTIQWSSNMMLIANAFGASSNMINGKVMNFFESTRRVHYTKSNLVKADLLYWGDIKNNGLDIGSITPSSKTNRFIEKFLGTSMGFNAIANDLTQDSRVKRLATVSTAHGLNTMAEHYVQGTLMYAMMDNIKLKNKDGKFVDKNGTVVEDRSDAAGMQDGYRNGEDSLEWNDDFTIEGFDKFDRKAERFVSGKVKEITADLQGMYDSKNKSYVQRMTGGRLATFLRNWMVKGTLARYRGLDSATTLKEDLEDHQVFYSEGAQEIKEGSYVTLIRYLTTLKKHSDSMGVELATKQWDLLSDSEKGNIKRAVTELAVLVLSLLAGGFLAQLAGEEDDEDAKARLFFSAYMMRRLYQDVSFYIPYNPSEMIRLMQSPTATIGTLTQTSRALGQIIEDVTWNMPFGDGMEEYQSGERKGKYKSGILWRNMVDPIHKNFLDRTAERGYKNASGT